MIQLLDLNQLDQLMYIKTLWEETKTTWVHCYHRICSNLLSVTAHKNKQARKKAWRRTWAKVVDWQTAWPFRTPVVCLGSSLESLRFIRAVPDIDLIQRPHARLPPEQTHGSEEQGQGWQGWRPHLAVSLLDGDQLPHSWLTGGLSRCRVSPAGKSWLMKSQPSQKEEN